MDTMKIYPWIYTTSRGIPRDIGSFLALRSQGFGENMEYYQKTFGTNGHAGHDHPCPKGTPVYSPFDSCRVRSISNDERRGKGVVLDVPGGRFLLWHFSRVLVEPGQEIKRIVVGLSGNSGVSTSPHTHAEFRPLNPDGSYQFPDNSMGGAVDFSAMLVWKPVYNEVMTVEDVKKLQALEGYEDAAGVTYWAGKPLSAYLDARLKDKVKKLEELL